MQSPDSDLTPQSHAPGWPERLLAAAVRLTPPERSEWGAAMLAEMAHLRNPAERRRFALSCALVALFPPDRGRGAIVKPILVLLGAVALVGLPLWKPETGGAMLAWAYLVYGMAFLAIPTALFGHWLVLAGAAWSTAGRVLGRDAWPRVPHRIRSAGRLAAELLFGLINPLLYLAILSSGLRISRPGMEHWLVPLQNVAWMLLAAVWIARICGGVFDVPASRAVRAGLRILLTASIACILAFATKDLVLLTEVADGHPLATFVLNTLRVCPLYLVPIVLLLGYYPQKAPTGNRGFFLLPSRASCFAAAGLLAFGAVTLALAAHRRSDANVRALVTRHREPIQSSASRYGVDPRLIAAIVYVTHRDQLSPFRDAAERLVIHTWGMNLLRRGPGREKWEEIGTDENPVLNRALDISVGVAQIKPRTAQTASVLATGHTPESLPRPAFYEYRDVEPVGDGWPAPVTAQTAMDSPIPVPMERIRVAKLLLDPRSNLDTCALILALYQRQWQAADPDWSIHSRPAILATLYQIGFSNSRPHGAPQSNRFGNRVGEVYEQPWLAAMFAASR